MTENIIFWKTVKPFLADKTKTMSRIYLIEDEKCISWGIQSAKSFNDYFINIPIANMEKKSTTWMLKFRTKLSCFKSHQKISKPSKF